MLFEAIISFFIVVVLLREQRCKIMTLWLKIEPVYSGQEGPIVTQIALRR